jgi:hypothetical protein
MAPLTWRDVAAPDLSGVSDMLQRSKTSFQDAFTGLSDMASGIRSNQEERASNAFRMGLAQYTDRAQFEQALASGSLFNGVNRDLLNETALSTLEGRRSGLLGEESTIHGMGIADQEVAQGWAGLDIDRGTLAVSQGRLGIEQNVEARAKSSYERGLALEQSRASAAELEGQAAVLERQGNHAEAARLRTEAAGIYRGAADAAGVGQAYASLATNVGNQRATQISQFVNQEAASYVGQDLIDRIIRSNLTDQEKQDAVLMAQQLEERAALGTGRARTGGAPADPSIWLQMNNSGATRNDPLSADLVQQMGSVLPALGLGFQVTSGGQESADHIRQHGEGTRTGATNHDGGHAGDGYFTDLATGERLDPNNPAHEARIFEAVALLTASGVGGIGFGQGYMSDGMFHIGNTNGDRVWGSDESSATADPRLVAAHQRGLAMRGQVGPTRLAAAQGATSQTGIGAPSGSLPSANPVSNIPSATPPTDNIGDLYDQYAVTDFRRESEALIEGNRQAAGPGLQSFYNAREALQRVAGEAGNSVQGEIAIRDLVAQSAGIAPDSAEARTLDANIRAMVADPELGLDYAGAAAAFQQSVGGGDTLVGGFSLSRLGGTAGGLTAMESFNVDKAYALADSIGGGEALRNFERNDMRFDGDERAVADLTAKAEQAQAVMQGYVDRQMTNTDGFQQAQATWEQAKALLAQWTPTLDPNPPPPNEGGDDGTGQNASEGSVAPVVAGAPNRAAVFGNQDSAQEGQRLLAAAEATAREQAQAGLASLVPGSEPGAVAAEGQRLAALASQAAEAERLAQTTNGPGDTVGRGEVRDRDGRVAMPPAYRPPASQDVRTSWANPFVVGQAIQAGGANLQAMIAQAAADPVVAAQVMQSIQVLEAQGRPVPVELKMAVAEILTGNQSPTPGGRLTELAGMPMPQPRNGRLTLPGFDPGYVNAPAPGRLLASLAR